VPQSGIGIAMMATCLGRTTSVKKILMSVAAVATLASAGAASAQPFGGGGYALYNANTIFAREVADARRISWCETHHRMSHRQAAQLRYELRMIQILHLQMRQGGLNYFEYRVLSRRLSQLESRIAVACRPDFVLRGERMVIRRPL
jgi:hypothetical protein